MNLLQPWNVVFLIGFALYVAIRGVYAKRAKGETITVRKVDWIEKALLVFVISGSLLLPLLYLLTPLLSFADYRLPAFFGWCGVAVMVFALWLFWRSHADLGVNWSVTLEIREGHQLVTNGVYRSIRHPMYSAIWLFSLSQVMLLENWLAGWSALAPFVVLYYRRAPREERMMCEMFGDDYRAYMRQTGRLFPRVRKTD